MNPYSLLDGASAAIVVGGTLSATFLQCGAKDSAAAAASVARLVTRRFDPARARAELAVRVRELRQDGVYRAEAAHTGDRALDEATRALIGERSVEALLRAHEEHKSQRIDTAIHAVRTLSHAADLSPVFGLAGTLIALSQMPAGGIAPRELAHAIAMAVLTTLYGLVLANLVLAPLARFVERARVAEERARQEVIDWLAAQLEQALPHLAPPARRAHEPQAASRAPAVA